MISRKSADINLILRIWGKRPEHPRTEKEIETAKNTNKEDIVAVIKEIIRLNDDPMAKPTILIT